MAGGLAFRKDCEDCGRSFLTPDRKARLCPRCAGKGLKKDQPGKISTKEHPSKFLSIAKTPLKKRAPKAPADNLKPQISKIAETRKIREEVPGSEAPEEGTGKTKAGQTVSNQKPEPENPEIVLTEAQEQEIIERYQVYVKGMERPPNGRRKTIAAEMGLPYRTIVHAVRKWNQSQRKVLSREENFSIEKTYFFLLKNESSFAWIIEQIARKTGLSPWEVSRYLDLLHDGEDMLRNIPDGSLEQRKAILAEYHNYLAGPSPPGPPLHALIAERTGVTPKQVHKVLLAYRLERFQERWS